ncbi:hypothetical protein OK016_09425 [Vibrio chagasii]|nr:hypothetical protein [Vibrio chagasii]
MVSVESRTPVTAVKGALSRPLDERDWIEGAGVATSLYFLNLINLWRGRLS